MVDLDDWTRTVAVHSQMVPLGTPAPDFDLPTVDGVGFVGICSNDPGAYPEDGPEGLRAQAERAGWRLPYAIDADSRVGRAYGAACTPDFFVYGPGRELVYRGGMDGSSPGNEEPHDGRDLRAALRLARAGEPVPEPHRPSMGCSITWAG